MKKVITVVLLAILVEVLAVAVAPAAKVTLVWYTWGNEARRRELFQSIADNYTKMNPDVEVQWIWPNGANLAEKLRTMMVAGESPDVMWLGTDVYTFADDLLPIDDLLTKDKTIKAILPNLLAMDRVGGHQVALPLGVNSHTMFYNKDMLGAAGMANPRPDWTMQDALQMAKQLTKDTNGDGTDDVFGMSIANSEWSYAWGSDFYSPDQRKVRLTNGPGMAATQLINDYTLGKFPGYPVKGSGATIQNGRVAMSNVGIFQVPQIRPAVTFDWDVQLLPSFEYEGQKLRHTFMSLESWCVSKYSKHPDEAKAFLQYLYSPEVMKQVYWVVPAVPAYAAEFLRQDPPPANIMSFAEAMTYGRQLINQHPAFRTMWAWFSTQDSYLKFKAGEAAAAMVFPELEKGLQSILDDYWAKR